jgi:hypothetical protein
MRKNGYMGACDLRVENASNELLPFGNRPDGRPAASVAGRRFFTIR